MDCGHCYSRVFAPGSRLGACVFGIHRRVHLGRLSARKAGRAGALVFRDQLLSTLINVAYRTSPEWRPGDGQTLPAIMGQPSLTVRREPAVIYGEEALRWAWASHGKALLGLVEQGTIELGFRTQLALTDLRRSYSHRIHKYPHHYDEDTESGESSKTPAH